MLSIIKAMKVDLYIDKSDIYVNSKNKIISMLNIYIIMYTSNVISQLF